MVLINVSETNPIPVAGLLEIPLTADLDQVNVVPDVADVALYKNVSPLHMAGGVSVEVSVGFGLTRTTTFCDLEHPLAEIVYI